MTADTQGVLKPDFIPTSRLNLGWMMVFMVEVLHGRGITKTNAKNGISISHISIYLLGIFAFDWIPSWGTFVWAWWPWLTVSLGVLVCRSVSTSLWVCFSNFHAFPFPKLFSFGTNLSVSKLPAIGRLFWDVCWYYQVSEPLLGRKWKLFPWQVASFLADFPNFQAASTHGMRS